ncbi:MAG: acylneuraminate cytidylyltransferase family protein [Planctomycetes bacterium]|nr:acylneuraminate cytidylyltransferase family protein [Planctomycetota bacterium]
MRVLCTICARGGSKGVPGKNLRPLAGRPLLVHSIEHARAATGIDRIVVSTDDERLADAARAAGADVPFLRPAELATDAAGKVPVLQHALRAVEAAEGRRYDAVLDLQPTSPLRSVEDIAGTLATLERTGADIVFSVTESDRNPYYNLVELSPEGWARVSKPLPAPLVRRQDAPKVYVVNGAVYAWRREALLEAGRVIGDRSAVWVMPEERSVDIDREVDFLLAEALLSRR